MALGKRLMGLQSDALNDELELEQAAILSDSENSDALALAMAGTAFARNTRWDDAMPKSAMAGLANMVFEDGVGPNARMVSATANVSKNPAPMDGNSLLGQNKAATEIIGPQQVQQNSAKVGENLGVNMENPLTKNMTSDLVKLQALRAANLEQQNADIDKEVRKS